MDTQWIVPTVNIKEGTRVARAGRPIEVAVERATALIDEGLAYAHEEDLCAGAITDDGDVVPLDEMRVPALKNMATDLGVEGAANMKKADLIAAIETAWAALEEGEGEGNDDGGEDE